MENEPIEENTGLSNAGKLTEVLVGLAAGVVAIASEIVANGPLTIENVSIYAVMSSGVGIARALRRLEGDSLSAHVALFTGGVIAVGGGIEGAAMAIAGGFTPPMIRGAISDLSNRLAQLRQQE